MDTGAVDRPPEQLLAARQPVSAVEEQAAEYFVLEVAQAGDQVIARRARAREHGPGLEPLEVMPAHDLERRLQLRPSRGADPRLVAKCAATCREQPAQRAEAAQQRTGEVERVHVAGAVPHPDGEELRLRQRARAEGEETFPRPLGRRPVANVHARSLAQWAAADLSQIAPVPG